MSQFRQIKMGLIDAEEIPEIAGHFQIFTVPVLLLFVEGKEVLREARIVHTDVLEKNIKRIYEAVVE